MTSHTPLSDLILENNRARLEPIEQRHFVLLAPIALGQDIVKYSPYTVDTEEGLQSFINMAVRDREYKERYAFAVFDKQANAYVGSSSYGHIFWEDKALEIGWTWLGKSVQGSGINKAIKHLMLGYAFGPMGFHRVEFRVHSQNARSRRAVEKIGALYEGELREHMVMPDGSRRSSVYFSILAPEWPEVERKYFSEL
jgi:RimJ/RimL family protein N-acetyltransferase